MTPTANTRQNIADQLLAHFRNPETSVEKRVANGIRRHRMGPAKLRFVNADGLPAADVPITVRQTRHDFLFGCNLFLLDGFKASEDNRAYERAFLDLFNSGVVPFYWSDLEPVRGQPRFAAGSPPIPRRPPPDVVVDFCERHRITPKGHCLVWHQWIPGWLPSDPDETGCIITRRIREIASRYGRSIPMWDVVNEPMEKHLFPGATMLPDDYIADAFCEAARAFPSSTTLFLNEATTYSWRNIEGRTTGLHLLEQNLLLRGHKIDGLGLQYHLFFYDKNNVLTTSVEDLIRARDTHLDPNRLFAALDLHAQTRPGRPIHISEITLPAYPDLPDIVAEDLQARLLRELYHLWFSHPGVEGIYWWNLADGVAHGRESALRAGLLREDLSPKPAYDALRQLIREEWTTCFTTLSDADGICEFSGFHGDYEITVEHPGGHRTTHTIGLHKNSPVHFTLNIDAPACSSRAAPVNESTNAIT
ncbi:glycoside hydrolase family 10 [Opitutaceae bacterium TAV5]|nr:glycoside hydrolase family 10 [Opitutaceae bacterium TAV5]